MLKFLHTAFYSTVLIFAFTALLNGNISRAQLPGYNYYNTITIQSSQVSGAGPLTDFPVLISHIDPDLATIVNGGFVENPNGWDIRFTAADGMTLLDQQIESYDPATGEIVFWVRIPTLSNSTNTNIRMYYGNNSIVSDPSTSSVWDANYQGVWHLDNSNNGATNFTNHLVTNNGSINETNSKIADGQAFDPGDYLSSGVEPELQIIGDVTVESWVKFNTLQGGTGDNTIVSCGLPGLSAPENHSYKLNVTGLNLLRAYWEYGSGLAVSTTSTIAAPISSSTWHHIAYSRDVSTNTVIFYFDGAQLGLPATYTNDPSDGASGVLSLGENFPGLDLNGSIDEPRISNVIRSSDWLQTSYNSMSNPSAFYTISSRMSTPPYWCWAEDALAGNNEAFLDLVTDPGSGVSYAVGYFNDDISLEFPTGVNNTPDMSVLLGNQDGLVAKYDLNGNPIWAFKIGAPGQEVWCTGVEIGSGGNIFVTGYYNDECEFQGVTGSPTSLLTALSQGGTNEEAFIASYDSDGNLRWVRQGSNIGEAMANDIATNATMVYTIGWFENSISFTGAPSITSNDNRDAFIVAYDQATGAYQWISHAGDISGTVLDDYGVAIAADDNEIYISGEHRGIIQFNSGPIQVSAPTPGQNNIWLAELDAASGNTNWANYIGGTDDCEANAIVINANDIFITGGIKGDVDFPGIGTITVPGTDNEIFICSIKRTTQATLWYDISENDDGNPMFGEDIILDNVGNVYYTGTMRGITEFNDGLDPISNVGGDDIFVSSYTVSGTYNWTQIATDNSDIISNGIGCDNDGGVYIAGMMDSQASFGSLPTLADAGGEDAFIAKISCSNPCAGPTITVCPPDITVTADPTCNHTIGSYLGATTATDDCGTGSVTITQSPAPFTVLAAGQHTITMTATDGNGDTDVCSWVLTIEADVNPVVAECGDTYLAQTTIGQGDNGNSFSCYGSATNGEDVYYQITVPSGNYLLGITLSNVTDNESQINTFWIGPGCPLGVTCLEENRYVVGAQKFISNNQNQLLFSATGPGTYYFVVDSELDGVTQYDIAFDCIVSGVEFDESGCAPDTDNDGIYSTINGLPTLDLTPCQTGVQVCNSIFVQNVMAGEWIDTVEMTLGPCYTNVTNFSPDAPGPNGFYDGAGTWSATFDGPSNSIQWAFDYSGAQDMGDGIGSNYNCLNYDFCFTADITSGCNIASDLDISIHIEDDGVNGLTPGVSNGFDDAVARFNLVDPPPTVSCPANVNVSVDPSACSAIVNSISPTASNDNCPSPAITYTLTGATTGSGSNDASGETFNLGTTSVTYTITDGAGNTNTCAFSVTVNDNEAPSITCPGNQTEIPNASCQFTLPDYTSLATALNDNCTTPGSITVSQSPVVGTVISANTTITLTADDGNGNTNTCTFDVLLDDSIAPTISCPGNVTVNNNPGVCTAIVNGIAPTSFGDNCTVASISYTLTGATTGSGSNDASGETFNLGTTTVTYTITDGAGNTNTCAFTVTVSDNEAPTITCPANVSANNDFGVCTAAVAGIAPTSSGDNCSVASISYTLTGATTGSGSNDASGEIFNLGTTTVTYTITDGAGNTSTCPFSVIVSDNEAPIITCPVNVIANNDLGVCNATVTNIAPISSGDNCSVASISYVLTGATNDSGSNDASGETFNLGTTTVTYTITDGAGNTNTCAFSVTVNDNEAPSITCPGNQTEIPNASCQFTLPDYTSLATALNDNCTAPGSITVSQSPVVGTVISANTTITLTADDGNGNTNTCTFDVLLDDSIAPTISCPGNVIVNNNPGVCTAIVNGIAPTSFGDNCTVASISYTLTGATTGSGGNDASGETFNLGTTTVTYTITDGAGNTNTCAFTVTVSDNEAPTITCPANVSANNDLGVCTAAVTGIAPTSSGDNCSVASISYTLSGATTGSGSNDASGEIFNLGTTTVTYTITDGAGNTGTCAFTVTVSDNEAPMITCPANVNANNDLGVCNAVVTGIAPTSSGDNCSVASITYILSGATTGSGSNDASGETFNLGTTAVTYTITDGAGNTNTCAFTVTVSDNEVPLLQTCPNNITQCDTIITWSAPTATDNCGIASITQIQGPPSGSSFPIGTTSISYIIDDINGNSVTCSFDVTILPPLNSIFWLPDTICLNGAGNIDLDDSTILNLSIPEFSNFYSDSSQVQINPNNLFNPQSTGPGTFPITHVVENGFCADTNVIEVTILPQYQSNFSGLDTLCAALDTFNLVNLYNGSSTQGGEFFGPSGANIFQDSLWILSGSSGLYDIGYTIGPGACADTTIKQIYLSPDVDPSWQLAVDSLCVSGAPIDLLPFVTGTINSTSLFSGTGVINTTFDPAGLSGELILTYMVGEGQCQESLNDTIFVVGTPVLDAGPDIEVCGDTAVVFGTSDTNLSWWTSSSDLLITDSSQVSGQIVSLLSVEGTYTVYLNANNGYCYAIDSAQISYYTQPTMVDAGPNQNLDYTFTTDLDAVIPDFGTGTWVNYTNCLIGNVSDPMSPVSNLSVGENVFYWVVTNGVCPSDSDYVVIMVDDIYIPSGFSPNDDNKNDFFVVPGIENASSSSVQIFNRWGSEVYSATNYMNDWQGESKSGQTLTNDTYYYIITVDDRKFSGYLIIRR